jgi:anaerobic ribonucleoside-triphosphate reductase activating protein
MSEPMLSVARWIERSRVNGPGERFVLWVQGCTLRCRGCWNRDTWRSEPAQTSVDALWARVEGARGIDGITLTGGEPFQQAEPLCALLDRCQSRGLSAMAFTGYELDELIEPSQRALLDRLDVVVTGRYRADLRSVDLPWRGSSNQRIRFLTERYGPDDVPAERASEVHLASDGSVVVTGFPEAELLRV